MSDPCPGTLCIRADADSTMGVGHVMRCLALAQGWQDQGGNVCLITTMRLPGLLSRMNDEKVEVVPVSSEPAGLADAEFTHATAVARGALWLVVDGYHFTSAFHQKARGQDLKLMVFDDLANQDLSQADLVLNQNAYARPEMYGGCRVAGELLLASPYALLRREFFPWKKVPAERAGECQRVMVTLGGADTANITLLVLRALGLVTGARLEVRVVAGTANQHLDSLSIAIEDLSALHAVTLHINPPNMPELMAGVDLAITAAGSSCWEFAFLGVPMLVLLTADNQVLVVDYLRKAGLASVFGLLTQAEVPAFARVVADVVKSAEIRADHASRAARLVDGGGAARVVQKLVDTVKFKV